MDAPALGCRQRCSLWTWTNIDRRRGGRDADWRRRQSKLRLRRLPDGRSEISNDRPLPMIDATASRPRLEWAVGSPRPAVRALVHKQKSSRKRASPFRLATERKQSFPIALSLSLSCANALTAHEYIDTPFVVVSNQ